MRTLARIIKVILLIIGTFFAVVLLGKNADDAMQASFGRNKYQH